MSRIEVKSRDYVNPKFNPLHKDPRPFHREVFTLKIEPSVTIKSKGPQMQITNDRPL